MNRDEELPPQLADLHAYFDGELDPGAAERTEQAIDADPALRRQLEQMSVLRGLIGRSLELGAADLPQARFAQVWDQIDRAISQGQARPVEPTSFWQRVGVLLRRFRTPLVAVAAASIVVVVVTRMDSPPPVNQDSTVASLPQAVVDVPAHKLEAKQPSSTAMPEPSGQALPTPKATDAEIHGIEFGSKQGRISHTGTLTVLYVDEDDSKSKSERSL